MSRWRCDQKFDSLFFGLNRDRRHHDISQDGVVSRVGEQIRHFRGADRRSAARSGAQARRGRNHRADAAAALQRTDELCGRHDIGDALERHADFELRPSPLEQTTALQSGEGLFHLEKRETSDFLRVRAARAVEDAAVAEQRAPRVEEDLLRDGHLVDGRRRRLRVHQHRGGHVARRDGAVESGAVGRIDLGFLAIHDAEEAGAVAEDVLRPGDGRAVEMKAARPRNGARERVECDEEGAEGPQRDDVAAGRRDGVGDEGADKIHGLLSRSKGVKLDFALVVVVV